MGSSAAETICNSFKANCLTADKPVATLSWISEMVDPESNIISTYLLPTIPLRTAALDCTAAVTTLTILGGPIVFRNAPGPGGASLCRFPNGNPLPGVQADHTSNTSSDLDNFAADDLAGDTGNTNVPWLVGWPHDM